MRAIYLGCGNIRRKYINGDDCSNFCPLNKYLGCGDLIWKVVDAKQYDEDTIEVFDNDGNTKFFDRTASFRVLSPLEELVMDVE